MFTSKEDLKLSYGIDMEIGKYFVDRKVPENNSYWKNRYLYINPMPGYLFIPIYADLQYRLGIPKSEILNDQHLQLVESILDCIGREEFSGQTYQQHIDECLAVARPDSKNLVLLEELASHFKGLGNISSKVQFNAALKALGRVDTYLFSLCLFDLDEATKQKLVDAWHAIMNFYLITDDLDDIGDDLKTGEPNAVIEAGLNEKGAARIENILRDSYEVMNAINPVFANRMDFSIQQINVAEIIRPYVA